MSIYKCFVFSGAQMPRAELQGDKGEAVSLLTKNKKNQQS